MEASAPWQKCFAAARSRGGWEAECEPRAGWRASPGAVGVYTEPPTFRVRPPSRRARRRPRAKARQGQAESANRQRRANAAQSRGRAKRLGGGRGGGVAGQAAAGWGLAAAVARLPGVLDSMGQCEYVIALGTQWSTLPFFLSCCERRRQARFFLQGCKVARAKPRQPHSHTKGPFRLSVHLAPHASDRWRSMPVIGGGT